MATTVYEREICSGDLHQVPATLLRELSRPAKTATKYAVNRNTLINNFQNAVVKNLL